MNRRPLNTSVLGSGVSNSSLWLSFTQSMTAAGDMVVSLTKNLSASVSMAAGATNTMAHMISLRASAAMTAGGDLIARPLRTLYLRATCALRADGALSTGTFVNLTSTQSVSADASLTPSTFRSLSATQSLSADGNNTGGGLFTGPAPDSRTFVSSTPSDRTFTMTR